MRLQKVLARAGIASRRKAIKIIENGSVEVNGRVVTEKGFGVDIDKDKITVAGKPISAEKYIYILLNKPKNCISTVSDPNLRKTVMDVVGLIDKRVYPVGRLDKHTTGLLLMTNDGELAYRLTHPKFGVEKTYEALVKGSVTQHAIDKIKRGLFVDGKKTQRAKVDLLFKDKEKSRLKVKIHEGRKHQVRLMLLTVGFPVKQLKRVNFGNLSLGTLKVGSCRLLTVNEISGLKKLVGL
ncbi:MAG: hypothetical protein AUJ89_00400 [Candidatus Omnitrophica bacterium CG1_02_43_210]|nr:MAG: hypothetical protein AUJ89_00400 [Candidatus Omnitrophica bacterium CG1_02_43_210]